MEEILEPGLVICDPHHHLWEDRNGSRYMMAELRADTGSGHHIEHTVYIDCRSGYRTAGPEAFRPVGETEFVVAADPGGFIAGIVSKVDLRLPEAADVLAAHVEAGGGRFRGIRQSSTWDASIPVRPGLTSPPPGLLADPAFRAGFAALGRAGLSFDAWLYHPQIGELTELALAVPETTVILDHLGGPVGEGAYAGRREEVRAAWRVSMAGLAACPNVFVKLGGIGMPLFGLDFHEHPEATTSADLAAAWAPDIRWCIEQFGTDRCMFESNFPVDNASCSYAVLWNAFKRIAADASPADKAALFHDTAVRAYRL
jgi:predicted TIM-barrel fold metal-dependent hydrolase